MRVNKIAKHTFDEITKILLAEREGFEPSMELPPYCISSAAH